MNGCSRQLRQTQTSKDKTMVDPRSQNPPGATGAARAAGDENNSTLPRPTTVQEVIATTHPTDPLSFLNLTHPHDPTSETVLAHILHALLSSSSSESTPIPPTTITNTLLSLQRAGYLDLDNLDLSTWEDRTQVLTNGGYTRFRERVASALGEIADLMKQKYDRDAAGLVLISDDDDDDDDNDNGQGEAREVVRGRIRELKGIRDAGAEVFLETMQGIVPSLAPFVSVRNRELARKLGLAGRREDLWEEVGRDAVEMARLCWGLSSMSFNSPETTAPSGEGRGGSCL
jgi:hypothetical protein